MFPCCFVSLEHVRSVGGLVFCTASSELLSQCSLLLPASIYFFPPWSFLFSKNFIFIIESVTDVPPFLHYICNTPSPRTHPPRPSPHYCLCPYVMHICIIRSLVNLFPPAHQPTPAFPLRFISLFHASVSLITPLLKTISWCHSLFTTYISICIFWFHPSWIYKFYLSLYFLYAHGTVE